MEEQTLPPKRTKWKSFKKHFFEFLMVFLAVAAGFFSENIREDFTNNKKGDAYIQAVAEDLRLDIYTLDSILAARKKKDSMLDSLLMLLHRPDISKHGNDVYYFARWAPRTYKFYSHDRTIIQLRNSGDWHLIKKVEVSKALQLYDELVRSLTDYIAHREESLIVIMYPSINKLFDNQVFNGMVNDLSFNRPKSNPPLRSLDKETINEFANQIHFLKNANSYYIKTSTTLVKNARATLALIEKEYTTK